VGRETDRLGMCGSMSHTMNYEFGMDHLEVRYHEELVIA
jgi:hypothetical protein